MWWDASLSLCSPTTRTFAPSFLRSLRSSYVSLHHLHHLRKDPEGTDRRTERKGPGVGGGKEATLRTFLPSLLIHTVSIPFLSIACHIVRVVHSVPRFVPSVTQLVTFLLMFYGARHWVKNGEERGERQGKETSDRPVHSTLPSPRLTFTTRSVGSSPSAYGLGFFTFLLHTSLTILSVLVFHSPNCNYNNDERNKVMCMVRIIESWMVSRSLPSYFTLLTGNHKKSTQNNSLML